MQEIWNYHLVNILNGQRLKNRPLIKEGKRKEDVDSGNNSRN